MPKSKLSSGVSIKKLVDYISDHAKTWETCSTINVYRKSNGELSHTFDSWEDREKEHIFSLTTYAEYDYPKTAIKKAIEYEIENA